MGDKPVLNVKDDLISITMSSDSYLHQCIMMDRWINWDGKPIDEKPLFYQGISQDCADILTTCSEEKVAIVKAIKELSRRTGLSRITSILEWYKRCYANDCEDKSTLFSAITTNRAYDTITHPMIQREDGKWVPNFNYRYLIEDVPCRTVVTKGVAEIVGVPTPTIDKVILWSQEKMGKEYLVDGKLKGKDLKETRAPQRYGFTILEDVLGM